MTIQLFEYDAVMLITIVANESHFVHLGTGLCLNLRTLTVLLFISVQYNTKSIEIHKTGCSHCNNANAFRP